MSDYWMVLALALLPALGNAGGALLAEVLPTPLNALNNALHAAAGIVIAVIAVELIPEALDGGISGGVLALAFALGGIVYLLAERAIDGILDKDRRARREVRYVDDLCGRLHGPVQ